MLTGVIILRPQIILWIPNGVVACELVLPRIKVVYHERVRRVNSDLVVVAITASLFELSITIMVEPLTIPASYYAHACRTAKYQQEDAEGCDYYNDLYLLAVRIIVVI